MQNRIFVVPNNDLEARTIKDMLMTQYENVFITNQGWGASWEGLEDNIKRSIAEHIANGDKVYGVELQGDPEIPGVDAGLASSSIINVDHHVYGQDDRSNPKSSIEQVADIIGHKLNRYEQLVSANDKGYIPEMREMHASWEEIADIRKAEREIQGITKEQEAQAEAAINNALSFGANGRDKIILMPHSKCAAVTDRLFGEYDNLLIISGDGESNFYGSTSIIKELQERYEKSWAGGTLEQGSGYWGGYVPQDELLDLVTDIFEDRERKGIDGAIEELFLNDKSYEKNENLNRDDEWDEDLSQESLEELKTEMREDRDVSRSPRIGRDASLENVDTEPEVKDMDQLYADCFPEWYNEESEDLDREDDELDREDY